MTFAHLFLLSYHSFILSNSSPEIPLMPVAKISQCCRNEVSTLEYNKMEKKLSKCLSYTYKNLQFGIVSLPVPRVNGKLETVDTVRGQLHILLDNLR